mgnify:FL=1
MIILNFNFQLNQILKCCILNVKNNGFTIGNDMGFGFPSKYTLKIKLLLVPKLQFMLLWFLYMRSLDIVPWLLTVLISTKFKQITKGVCKVFDPMNPFTPYAAIYIACGKSSPTKSWRMVVKLSVTKNNYF